MTREEFVAAVERARASHPRWFDLEPDRKLEPERRDVLERALGAQLPDDYVWFLTEYGGGDFAFTQIYSADEESSFYLPTQQEWTPTAVAFSDDGCGNLFVFPVVDGKARDEVLLWDHETGEIRRVEEENGSVGFDGFLDFVCRDGLRADE